MSPSDRALFFVNKSFVLNGKKDWNHAKTTAFFIVDELQKELKELEVKTDNRNHY